MNLNLPIFDQVADCKCILIAGMGGGFDIFCGLPIYIELKERGLNVHLANYSFTDFSEHKDASWLAETLFGITADIDTYNPYFPELSLAQWLRDKRGEEATIWCFQKEGVQPLLEAYKALVAHLGIDAIILIDGGVDSLMHGDESEMGTIVEDTVSLVAVSLLENVPVRLTACVAMGAERDMSYPQVFENIAELAQADAFLGSCSLTKRFASYQAYEEAVLFAQKRPYQDPSVINSSIISAVQGFHGNYHMTTKTKNSHLSISPLMAIYWFFEFDAVVQRNMFIDTLRDTDTFMQAFHKLIQRQRELVPRKPSRNRFG